MSTPQHPVGRRHPPAVYRRRRLVVLLALLAIIALVVLLVLRPGRHSAAKAGGTPAAAVVDASRSATPSAPPQPTRLAAPQQAGTPTAKPAAKATPKAAPKATPAAKAATSIHPCTPANVDVEAITDASSYGPSARPLLSLSLTNTGAQMCSIDAGTATMVFTITSGREQYWTSTDCQTDPVHTLIKLEPHQTLSSVPIPWDRTRSSKTTCNKTRPAVPAGGASYHLAVSLDGIASKTTKQFLLD